MRTIIIDDEKQTHEAIARLLVPANKDVHIVGNGYSVAEGLVLAHQHHPDLVLLDVEMPDGTGFDLLEKIGKPAFHVVFITAYNKYAETAFRFGALDFLTKPLDADLLDAALDRVRKRQSEQYTLEQLQIALETFHQAKDKKLPKRIAISSSKGLEMMTVEDILYMEADLNYTDFHYLHLGKKNKVTASLNLKVYEQHFEPYPEFMKVHRSHIVNLMMVDRYLKGDNALVMRDGGVVAVARGFKEGVEGRLGGI
jgi:two-component system, LytTR family, response regulator